VVRGLRGGGSHWYEHKRAASGGASLSAQRS